MKKFRVPESVALYEQKPIGRITGLTVFSACVCAFLFFLGAPVMVSSLFVCLFAVGIAIVWKKLDKVIGKSARIDVHMDAPVVYTKTHQEKQGKKE